MTERDHETAIARLHAMPVRFVMTHGLGYVYSGHPVTGCTSPKLSPDLPLREPPAPAPGAEWSLKTDLVPSSFPIAGE